MQYLQGQEEVLDLQLHTYSLTLNNGPQTEEAKQRERELSLHISKGAISNILLKGKSGSQMQSGMDIIYIDYQM